MGKGCVRAKGSSFSSSFCGFFLFGVLYLCKQIEEKEKGKVKRCCPNFVPFEEKSAALVCNACNASNRKELTNYFILFWERKRAKFAVQRNVSITLPFSLLPAFVRGW